jgi:acyl-CoA reductase-like NAD-dependent aldehyde dehydrogenase
MGKRPADRAAIPYLAVANQVRRLRQEWTALAEQLVSHDLLMGRHRANPEGVAVGRHAAQIAQGAKVDHMRRLRQPELHHRQQAMTARQQLGVVAILTE